MRRTSWSGSHRLRVTLVLVRKASVLLILVLVIAAVAAAPAQYGGPRGSFRERPNVPYDGRFTFVRVKYTTAPGGYWYGGWPAWGHGYPIAEQNLMNIMNEVSYLNPHVDEVNTITFDDPELFKYPIAYVIEVDWWAMTDAEAAALRAYIQKGGFVIVDTSSRAAAAGSATTAAAGTCSPRHETGHARGKFKALDASDKIFHSFFEVDDLDIIPQAYIGGRPQFYGLFEDNDRTKRMQMIVNYNTDVSQSGSGRAWAAADRRHE